MLAGWTVHQGGSPQEYKKTPRSIRTMAGNRAQARKRAEEKIRNIRRTERAPVPGLDKAMTVENLTVVPRDPRVNWYLIMLLDPTKWEEALAHGVRGVPDFYSHRNHIFVSRTVHELDASNFDADGKCTIINRPSLSKHLSYSDAHGVQDDYAFGNFYRTAGYLALRDDDYNPDLLVPAYLANGQTRAFPTKGVLVCDDNTGSCKSILASNPTASATLYQFPVTANAGNVVSFNITLIQPVTVAGNVTLQVQGSSGVSTAVIPVAIGDTTISGTVTMNAADVYVSTIAVLNGSGGDLHLNSAEVIGSLFSATSFTSLLAEPIQNYDFAKTNLTAYRPVAGYCWVKYRGKLTANGSVAGALIDSATNPVLSRVSDYDTIAGLLHSYEGSLTEGNYTIWCPMNPRDTNYTDVTDDRPEAPYIAVGIDASDTDSQQVRLESFWVWEGLTQNQMLAPKPGSVDIEMMNDAFSKLAFFDKSMENDLHLKKIASFLASGARQGLQGIKRYLSDPNHRSSMLSAARTLASMGGVLSPSVSSAVQMALRALQAANG